jgi:hypothetical protein
MLEPLKDGNYVLSSPSHNWKGGSRFELHAPAVQMRALAGRRTVPGVTGKSGRHRLSVVHRAHVGDGSGGCVSSIELSFRETQRR